MSQSLEFLCTPQFNACAAGAKAGNLHHLATAGFRVPPGFVVSSNVDLDVVDDEELARAVAHIGGLPVAVRSSCVLEDLDDASFAGQYDTYLNVDNIEDLRRRITDCRASSGNERAQAYLADRGLDPQRAAVAVLVQRLINARTSGVGFSLDPVSGIEDHAVVECCSGLGDRLVSGQVTPTRLVVRLEDGAVVERVEGEELVVLTNDEAAELAGLLLAVQANRHRPQDVEWAIDTDGQLWLLQSRAISAIRWRTDIEHFSDADLRDGGVSARVCTPLMYSLYDNAFQPTMQRYFEQLKLLNRRLVPDWMAMFYGRPYWNADAVKRCLRRIPGYDEARFDRDLGVQKDYGPDGPQRTPTSASTVARAIPAAVALPTLYRRQLVAVTRFARKWPKTLATWRQRVARLPTTDEATFQQELADCLFSFHAATERTYFTTIYNNANVQSDFKALIDKVDSATDGSTSVIDLMGGLADISHMAMQQGIVVLHGVAQREGFGSRAWHEVLNRFLDQHGFHADRELDLTCPRWSETPERVEAMVTGMLHGGTPPADPGAAAELQRQRFEAELADVSLRLGRNPIRRLRFGRALARHVRRARRYLVARERMREFSAQCYAVVRTYVLEAGTRLAVDERLAAAEDVFMLNIHELVDLMDGHVRGDELAGTISYRRAIYDGYRDASPPHELGRGVAQTATADLSDRRVLTGLACSPGVAEGTARVVPSLDETDQLRPGDILVTRFTDPGWTPTLGLVAGIVTEVGGVLSHAAVIGREYGTPAVLNIKNATSLLRSGQRIRVDGSSGTVELLDTSEREGFDVAATMSVSRTAEVRRFAPRKRFICITGGDGSGKTTQVARLAAEFESEGLRVAPVTIWDAFLDPTTTSKLPFKQPNDVYDYLALLGPVSRAHFLFHALHLAVDLAARRDADVLLANAYWYKYFATEVAHGGDPATLLPLTLGFAEPDVTFHLSIPPHESLARKPQRSDYESGYGDDGQAFVDFQQRVQDVLQDLAVDRDWIGLDGAAAPDEITGAIVKCLVEEEQ